MDTQRIQNMVYDQTQHAWVAIGHQPTYRRAGFAIRALRSIWGAAKATVLVALGVAAAGIFFQEAPWYSRLWAAITGEYPWFWPF